MTKAKPQPYELWKKANKEFPDDDVKRVDRYRELMSEAEYIVPVPKPVRKRVVKKKAAE